MKLTNGKERRCHQDQVRKRSVEVPQDSSHIEPDSLDIPDIDLPSDVTLSSTDNTEHSNTSGATSTESNSTNVESVSPNPVSTQNADAAVVNPTPRSYPKRNRAPVVRFEPTWT